MKAKPWRAVSLFSNCGAGDVGYSKAGFSFDVMAELDPRRLEVCLLNHPGATGVAGDLTQTWQEVVTEYRSVAKHEQPALLAACPPCQGMSSARSYRGDGQDADAGIKDSRNLLVTVVAKVAQELRPKIVVLENVQAFLNRQVRHPSSKRSISAARLLIEGLSDYTVFPISVDLCDYGVPQTRKRAFLTFVRRDLPVLADLIGSSKAPYPLPTHAQDMGGKPITLREALTKFGLRSLDAVSEATANSRVGKGLHCVPVWPDRRYAMVAAIPRHTGRTAWANRKCQNCGSVTVGADRASCPECRGPLLRPTVRNGNGSYRLIHGFRSSTYARMASDEPAATITTASGHIGSNHTIHPWENRLLSTLECAYLQTFPRDFDWGTSLEKWGHTNLRGMIGEAVPPKFTQLHGSVLVQLLQGRMPKNILPADNVRCVSAKFKLDNPSKEWRSYRAMSRKRNQAD
jgi:DNA (cytosine-5)-methyltransferase 1